MSVCVFFGCGSGLTSGRVTGAFIRRGCGGMLLSLFAPLIVAELVF